ncbi:MAG: hypothetical protein JWQ35_1651 [Bacteriovoracaceae bacterium]|nr:hypothetical protein [Bacteriovoracaceae bacterium]
MDQILISGADGYLGFRLAQKYLAETTDDLMLWVRARSQEEFDRKRFEMSRKLPKSGRRIHFTSGVLTEGEPFSDVSPRSIKKIIHAAEINRFDVSEVDANEVNLKGSQKLFTFARLCSNLETLAYVSTLYTSGLKAGVIEELPFDSQSGFSNHYERSKWEAENSLISEFNDLPWQIHRVSTVISDDDSGGVTHYHAIHHTLKLFYYGLLPSMPGEKTTPLYFVTGQFATQAIFNLIKNGENHKFFNIAHQASDSLSLEEFIHLGFEVFEKHPDFKSRKVSNPLFVDYEAFKRLFEVVQGMGGEVMSQALATIMPIAKQLFVNKKVKNDNTIVGMESEYKTPNTRELLTRVTENLIQTNWGNDSEKKGTAH